MANVNLFELEDCLETLVAFFDKYPRKSYVQRHGATVRAALADLRASEAEADEEYFQWRRERADHIGVHKKIHRTIKRIATLLEEEGAIGYPEGRVDYFDENAVVAEGRAMRDYLRTHRAALPGADEHLESLNKLLESHAREGTDRVQSRTSYSRTSMRRKKAMDRAENVIKLMLPIVRDDLGRSSEEYRSVRWPAVISGDAF